MIIIRPFGCSWLIVDDCWSNSTSKSRFQPHHSFSESESLSAIHNEVSKFQVQNEFYDFQPAEWIQREKKNERTIHEACLIQTTALRLSDLMRVCFSKTLWISERRLLCPFRIRSSHMSAYDAKVTLTTDYFGWCSLTSEQFPVPLRLEVVLLQNKEKITEGEESQVGWKRAEEKVGAYQLL